MLLLISMIFFILLLVVLGSYVGKIYFVYLLTHKYRINTIIERKGQRFL